MRVLIQDGNLWEVMKLLKGDHGDYLGAAIVVAVCYQRPMKVHRLASVVVKMTRCGVARWFQEALQRVSKKEGVGNSRCIL